MTYISNIDPGAIDHLKLQKTKAASVEQGNNRYSRWTKTRVPAEYGIFAVMADGTQGQIATVVSMGGKICPEWWIKIERHSLGSSLGYEDAVRLSHQLLGYDPKCCNYQSRYDHVIFQSLADVRFFLLYFNSERLGYEG
jgi:hypothetical protein